MAPRFDVRQQCYSSGKPYSGFDQQQSLTCDPNETPATLLQKLNYTIYPNDQFVIRDQSTLQRSNSFQKGNLALFKDKDLDTKGAPFFGVAGVSIERLLTQSVSQEDALQIIDNLIGDLVRLEHFLLESGVESDPSLLQHLLQVRRALQTGDPVFDNAVNRETIIGFARDLDPFIKAANLPPDPVKTVAVTDYGITIRFESGGIMRGRFADPTAEELASWASRPLKEVLELGCLNPAEEGKIFLDRFRAAIDVLKNCKTDETNTKPLVAILEEVFKSYSPRIEYLVRNRPDILEQIAERYEAVLAASEELGLGRLATAQQSRLFEATIQAWFNEITQIQLALLDVKRASPLPPSAAEVLSVTLKRIEKWIEILTQVAQRSPQEALDFDRAIAYRLIDQLQTIQRTLQSGTGEAGIPSDIQKMLTQYQASIDMMLVSSDVYIVPSQEAFIALCFGDQSYAALEIDPNKIRSLSSEQIRQILDKFGNLDFDAFFQSSRKSVPVPVVAPLTVQPTTELELEQLYNNLKAVSQVAQRGWLRDAIQDLDQIFNPATHQDVRKIYVALVEMLTDVNDLRKMNAQIQVFLQQPTREEELINIFPSLRGFISRINFPLPSSRNYQYRSIAAFAYNFSDSLAHEGYTADTVIKFIEYVNANVRDGAARLQIIEYLFKGDLDFPSYPHLRLEFNRIVQTTRSLPRTAQPVEPISSGEAVASAASQASDALSQTDDISRGLTEGGISLTQAGRISFWTYLGLGGNIAGVVLGIPATLYSIGVTIVDTFDPKVSWTEVAIDAGLTATTGAGTFYAVGGVLYTGIWYFLTGTVAVAGAPLAIGAGLFAAGGSLAYAKEGKKEDREAKDFHGVFFQNISPEQKAKQLAKLADKADDEAVDKTLSRLKTWNKEFLNPDNPEAQALWRSNVKGANGEKPFAQEMRDTAKGYWIGSKDDAVSLVVLAQLMGNQEDLIYALKKVDQDSYEEFRQAVPGLKSFEDLKKNGLTSPSPSIQPAKGVDSSLLVCEVESVSVQNKS